MPSSERSPAGALLIARRRPLSLNLARAGRFLSVAWFPDRTNRWLQLFFAPRALWAVLRERPRVVVFLTTSPANRLLARAIRALGAATRTVTFDQFLSPDDVTIFDRVAVYSPGEIGRYPERLRGRFRSLLYPAKTERYALEVRDGGSVFACGAHDRDWATFSAAARLLPPGTKVVIAAGGSAIPNPDPSWEILGRVPEAEYYARMAEASVVVIPLLENLVPHGHCDASAATFLGKPVVSNADATVDSYCRPEHSALVPAADACSLAEAIGGILADSDRRARMSAAALARRPELSFAGFVAAVEEIVAELAEEPAPRPSGEICGDEPLSWGDRFRYLGRNALWNAAGALARLSPRRYVRRVADASPASPLRSLIEGFFIEELPKVLGVAREISVVDIGGGSGYARGLLAAAGYRGRYLSVDPVPDPRFEARANPSFESRQVAELFERFDSPERFDLVLSVTSLEHVPEVDAAARNAARLRGAPGGVEVHVVPGGWALLPYLWHGWRQFSRGRLRDLFGADAEIYALGGAASLLLHLLWCTVPERLTASDRLRRTRAYRAGRSLAQRIDRILPLVPIAYVAVRRS